MSSMFSLLEYANQSKLLQKHCCSSLEHPFIKGVNHYDINGNIIHAEADFINKLYNYLENKGLCEKEIRKKITQENLIIIRINRKEPSKLFSLSKPCSKCLSLLKQYGLKEGSIFKRQWRIRMQEVKRFRRLL